MTGPVVLTIHPLSTPARDLPMGMVLHICDVLDAYGLQVKDEALEGRGIVEVMQALVRVVDFVPVELGGRFEPPKPVEKDERGWPKLPGVVELPDEGPVRWTDTGSGPGWIQKDEPRD